MYNTKLQFFICCRWDSRCLATTATISDISFKFYLISWNVLNMNVWLHRVYITTLFNLIYGFMKCILFKIEIACNRMQFSKMLHEVSETKVLHHWRCIEYRKLCSNTTTVHQFYIVCMHILWTDFKWSLNCMLRNSIYYTLTYVHHKDLPILTYTYI